MTPDVSVEPFFARSGDVFAPYPVAQGFWSASSLHGRVVVGLLGMVIEQRYGSSGFIPARLTVDMCRTVPYASLTVRSDLVRDGRRIRLVRAELLSGDVAVAFATCQFLQQSRNPDDPIWSLPNWTVPRPEEMEEPADAQLAGNGKWMARPIFERGQSVHKRMWLREVRSLVGGAPLTPFVRVAIAADHGSPLANRSDKGVDYINTDLTLYLHRLPTDAWIGLDTINHHATDGVAIAGCALYDQSGPIGMVATASIPPMTTRQ
jgi:hypothetical protein